ncbi:MAG: DUF6228 family protein [Proteobacteria bacterium]|nr:DUF6228 family protein [Pseudomonadota bacterium]
MSSQVLIKSDSEFLVLGPRENDYLSVVFHSDYMKFEVKPYLYKDAQELVLFFKEMANNWKGWSGVKAWKSIEGDLKFDAAHDNLGHIKLKISLIRNQGEEDESKFVGNLKIELGSLERLAADVEIMLNSK